MIKQKGFTLIELLLVIAIISLLSSVSFFSFTEAKKKGEDAKMKADAGEVRKAIELYKLDNNGRVPDPGSTLRGQMVREGSLDNNGFATAMEKLVPKYLSEVPESPSGEAYSYLANNTLTEAVFAASLNYEDSNSGSSNSCSIIDSGGDEYSISAPFSGFFVSDEEYGSYCSDGSRLCEPFDSEAEAKSNFKTKCIDSFNSNVYYDNLKSWDADNYCESYTSVFFTDYGDANYDYLIYYDDQDSHTVIEIDGTISSGSVCDGSTSSDYCQCI